MSNLIYQQCCVRKCHPEHIQTNLSTNVRDIANSFTNIHNFFSDNLVKTGLKQLYLRVVGLQMVFT